MYKSKEYIESSDSDDNERSAAGKTVAPVKQSKTKSSSKTNDSPAKRPKAADQSNSAVASKAGPSGERLYEIARSRYVSVSEFRGRPYVNIREYYDDKGVEKPGKKGISLGVDQWEKLKSLVDQVDKDLKRFK